MSSRLSAYFFFFITTGTEAHKEAKCPLQSHTADKQQSWDFSSGNMTKELSPAWPLSKGTQIAKWSEQHQHILLGEGLNVRATGNNERTETMAMLRHRGHQSQPITETWRHCNIALPMAMLTQMRYRNMSNQPYNVEGSSYICAHLSVYPVMCSVDSVPGQEDEQLNYPNTNDSSCPYQSANCFHKIP